MDGDRSLDTQNCQTVRQPETQMYMSIKILSFLKLESFSTFCLGMYFYLLLCHYHYLQYHGLEWIYAHGFLDRYRLMLFLDL